MNQDPAEPFRQYRSFINNHEVCAAWSPCGNYFAWLREARLVQVIEWQRHALTVEDDKVLNPDAGNAVRIATFGDPSSLDLSTVGEMLLIAIAMHLSNHYVYDARSGGLLHTYVYTDTAGVSDCLCECLKTRHSCRLPRLTNLSNEG